jgi:hypothetical protein
VTSTETDEPTTAAADRALSAIRTEWERSISDAYAGGPTGRDRVWNRLRPLIDQYADAKAEGLAASTNDDAAPSAEKHEDSSRILTSDTAAATNETVETEPPGQQKPPRAKPTARKATAS